MMNSIVDIVTMFDKPEDRTLEKLKEVYEDKERLKTAIRLLISPRLNADIIKGKKVLIKPNWVSEEKKDSDYLCLRTNNNLLFVVLEEILQLNPQKVLVADAPVQGAYWDRIITKDFLSKIAMLEDKYGVKVEIKDFRRTITEFGKNKISNDLHPIEDYIFFNVGNRSYLEPITREDDPFRVTCYDPDRMAKAHHKGFHRYCVAKDVFENDIIITMPKLKTHRMAGMTNALKLLVGINGDKDYLPHHRIGSVDEGGDCYKDKNLLRTISNHLTDIGNKHRGTKLGWLLTMSGVVLWKMSFPNYETLSNAGWYGNDTIWRTVLDLNTIALYGDCEGKIHDSQQRKLFAIMDGIVGGQGDGPLHPDPAPLGVLAYSDNPYLMDVVAGYLYHLKHNNIPLLREAMNIIKKMEYSVRVNGKEINLEEIRDYGIDVCMSPGWINYNK